MKVLLVGSGGREDALAWALHRSPRLGQLHCAPGNPGMYTYILNSNAGTTSGLLFIH